MFSVRETPRGAFRLFDNSVSVKAEAASSLRKSARTNPTDQGAAGVVGTAASTSRIIVIRANEPNPATRGDYRCKF